MRVSRLIWAIVLTVVSAAGCTLSGHGNEHSASNSTEGGVDAAGGRAPADAAHQPKIEVHEIQYGQLDPLIRGYRGKVVVVDFWMFNCKPCKAGFPYLVQLHEKYGSHGLVVLTVNMDDPANSGLRQQSLVFLNQKKARFTNLLLAEGEKPLQWVQMRSDINKGGTGFEGELPFTEVYDKKGTLTLHQVDVNHDELDELVQKLLLAE
jgi:thiol-disulfide isomerase/thioredoxin